MPRPSKHLVYTQSEKFDVFRKAYAALNAYVLAKEYLAAHVIAFSILEDRVLAARIQCGELNNSPIEKKVDKNKIPFERSAAKLREWEVIDDDLLNAIIQCGEERNEFIHQAMWRLEEFNYTSIVQLRKTINAVENSRKKHERRMKKIGASS
jgi:hypothetical protein